MPKESLLEFKRKFVLENLERVKKGSDRVVSNCDNVKKWLITIWSGTIAISIKEEWVREPLLQLLSFEILSFYVLEVHFRVFAVEYAERITGMEKWILKATDEEILGLDDALCSKVPTIESEKKFDCFLASIKHRYTLPFYSYMIFASIIIFIILN